MVWRGYLPLLVQQLTPNPAIRRRPNMSRFTKTNSAPASAGVSLARNRQSRSVFGYRRTCQRTYSTSAS